MLFSAVFALAGLAAATPVARGLTDVTFVENLSVRKIQSGNTTTINSFSLDLSNPDYANTTCTMIDAAGAPPVTAQCEDSNGEVISYRATIWGSSDSNGAGYSVEVVHSLGALTKIGQEDVPVYCRAGGAGPDDFVCNQVGGSVEIDLNFV
ncbi:hypothetical protein GMORB2_7743 [Geosmithia morbida]|uniref:AA1-like domain-containing protein n=1 Tax=Geosmithia morbida TaxID=1094350 RepID=A0A9P5D3U5_9HYPO|nr:uncharacterized protein GMORB2_7743 [Geosmithia morbida]KAF4122150.1 hypothetical protein GMORB2_7743 [Geosmithia morbida]